MGSDYFDINKENINLLKLNFEWVRHKIIYLTWKKSEGRAKLAPRQNRVKNPKKNHISISNHHLGDFWPHHVGQIDPQAEWLIIDPPCRIGLDPQLKLDQSFEFPYFKSIKPSLKCLLTNSSISVAKLPCWNMVE